MTHFAILRLVQSSTITRYLLLAPSLSLAKCAKIKLLKNSHTNLIQNQKKNGEESLRIQYLLVLIM